MSSSSTEVAPAAPHKPLLGSCWGCRILTGLALMGSSVWVFMGSRRVMHQKSPPNMWHIIPLTFALGLLSWGVIVIANPGGKLKWKE